MARIGTVGYLNARPLSDQVDIDRHTLLLAHPAEVARMLRDGEVDVALVPVAAVLGEPGCASSPGSASASEGPGGGSVLLAAETPPEQWTKVVLDGASPERRWCSRGCCSRRAAVGARPAGDLRSSVAPNTAPGSPRPRRAPRRS